MPTSQAHTGMAGLWCIEQEHEIWHWADFCLNPGSATSWLCELLQLMEFWHLYL